MHPDLPVRILVLRPPGGVTFAVQKGKDELLPPAEITEEHLTFDFTLRVHGDPQEGPPNFRGPFAQGPPHGRFVYVNSGTAAGQHASVWTRRAKIQLGGIGWDLIAKVQAKDGALLEARIAGTGKDGGPACATVPLVGGGWKVVP
ncbi:MAG TPA: DUF5990 family protein [Thermoanaerobaculia bacterium]|jgi:hypothetical protein|nr:DUF5990 family protein [Thermoanaerobaculia bacterium]